jgi:hypothetical protein
MISPSLGSLSTGRSENSVSSVIAGNFRWQKLPEGSDTFEITPSAAHANDSPSPNKSSVTGTNLNRVCQGKVFIGLVSKPPRRMCPESSKSNRHAVNKSLTLVRVRTEIQTIRFHVTHQADQRYCNRRCHFGNGAYRKVNCSCQSAAVMGLTDLSILATYSEHSVRKCWSARLQLIENLPAPYLLVRCQPAHEQAARQTADYRFDAATPLNCCATSCVVFSQTRKVTPTLPGRRQAVTRPLPGFFVRLRSYRSPQGAQSRGAVSRLSVRRGRTA